MKSYSTLADMKKTIEDSSSSSGTGKRFIYLRDGDNYKVRFRQELTEDGANHNDEAGTGVVVPVVTSPINWKFKAMSTAGTPESDYRCWATEQIGNDRRWKPRPVLLINAGLKLNRVSGSLVLLRLFLLTLAILVRLSLNMLRRMVLLRIGTTSSVGLEAVHRTLVIP